MADYYLNSFRVSSEFGESRATGGHNAVDFAGKKAGGALGMNIPSIVGGKVINVWKGHKSIGNGVAIQGSDGRVYRYIHMQSAPSLKVGQKVKQGASLGKIGSTGRSTGPHLDLQVKDRNGKFEDPMSILKAMQGSASPGGMRDLSQSRTKKSTSIKPGTNTNFGRGYSGYKNYKKIDQATKAPGYQTYKKNLTKAVQDGKISEAWAYDLTELVGRESTWNHKAKNPKSSAFGYGQLIKANVAPYEKKTGVKYSDPYGQIIITAQYVKDRYGSPKKALEFWDKNGWY